MDSGTNQHHPFGNQLTLSLFCSIIMEYADDGDVYQRVTDSMKNKIYLKEKYIWKVIIQCLRGLKVLHDLKILHRDIKSANFFLFKCGQAKIGDLNVSKV